MSNWSNNDAATTDRNFYTQRKLTGKQAEREAIVKQLTQPEAHWREAGTSDDWYGRPVPTCVPPRIAIELDDWGEVGKPAWAK